MFAGGQRTGRSEGKAAREESGVEVRHRRHADDRLGDKLHAGDEEVGVVIVKFPRFPPILPLNIIFAYKYDIFSPFLPPFLPPDSFACYIDLDVFLSLSLTFGDSIDAIF